MPSPPSDDEAEEAEEVEEASKSKRKAGKRTAARAGGKQADKRQRVADGATASGSHSSGSTTLVSPSSEAAGTSHSSAAPPSPFYPPFPHPSMRPDVAYQPMMPLDPNSPAGKAQMQHMAYDMEARIYAMKSQLASLHAHVGMQAPVPPPQHHNQQQRAASFSNGASPGIPSPMTGAQSVPPVAQTYHQASPTAGTISTPGTYRDVSGRVISPRASFVSRSGMDSRMLDSFASLPSPAPMDLTAPPAPQQAHPHTAHAPHIQYQGAPLPPIRTTFHEPSPASHLPVHAASPAHGHFPPPAAIRKSHEVSHVPQPYHAGHHPSPPRFGQVGQNTEQSQRSLPPPPPPHQALSSGVRSSVDSLLAAGKVLEKRGAGRPAASSMRSTTTTPAPAIRSSASCCKPSAPGSDSNCAPQADGAQDAAQSSSLGVESLDTDADSGPPIDTDACCLGLFDCNAEGEIMVDEKRS